MNSVYDLLVQYKYLFLFPLAVAEGPVICILAGFLASNGLLQLLPGYFIIIGGNLFGDTLYYSLGRFSNKPFVHKIIVWLGLNQSRFEKAQGFLFSNLFKTISLSKIVWGVGVLGLFFAGKAKVPYHRYLFICLITAIFQCAGYLAIGWFFGKAYMEMDKFWLYTIAMIVMLFVGIYIFIRIRLKRNAG